MPSKALIPLSINPTWFLRIAEETYLAREDLPSQGTDTSSSSCDPGLGLLTSQTPNDDRSRYAVGRIEVEARGHSSSTAAIRAGVSLPACSQPSFRPSPLSIRIRLNYTFCPDRGDEGTKPSARVLCMWTAGIQYASRCRII